ncbi:MAG: UvrD-helicase domain-containing protein [Acidobacteria bacterium]|nr:UvrD-helicase domain-containing protein [Acidobacteriota bacterium]
MDSQLDHPLLRGLNPPQQQAVKHVKGPLLILAGAGSGKTTVITRRIAWLVEEEGVNPSSILAVTFTNKAAEEMRERVSRLVSVPVNQLWVSTFHSFCTRLLRREGDRTPVGKSFVIFDPSDQKSLIKQVLAELKLSEKQFHPRKVLEHISDWKNRCLLPEEAKDEALDAWSRKVLDAYALYQKGLTNHRACDFDDLLLHAERLLREPVMQEAYAQKFRHVLVDEYQDTNFAQYKLVQHLAGLHKNLCVVGDEDQCLIAGTRIRLADGRERAIEKVKVGDLVLSCHGSGDMRPAPVTRVHRREGRKQGVEIRTESGRKVVSTPDHTHFAGYRLGLSPQWHFVYLMRKEGMGWRLGTTQVHTRGQAKPVEGFKQRALQEHADELWVVGVHGTENEARAEEVILSLQHGIPALPFVPRRGASSKGLVHDGKAIARVFQALEGGEAGARTLLRQRGLSEEHPHHSAQGATGRRRNLVLTLCGDRRGRTPMHRISMVGQDAEGRRVLETMGYSVRAAKAGSTSWRFETCRKDFQEVMSIAESIQKRLGAQLVMNARLGQNGDRAESNSLPMLPASNVQPGMVLFDAEGGYDTVVRVSRVALEKPVFDLDIPGTHNFVANGLLTHNSIYGWRGADIRNILDFQRDFPGAVQIKLEQNYRSTQSILDAASTVIANNSQRLGKTLWTDLGQGERLSFRLLDDGRAEAEHVARRIREERAADPEGRVAILYRANWQSRPLEEALRGANLAYKLVGGTKFYERQEIKDLISYLRLGANPFDLTSFRRSVNTPSRGIGPTTLAKIEAAIPENGTPIEGVAALLKEKAFTGRSQREMLRFHDLFAKAEGERRAQPLSGFIRWMLHESGLLQALVDEDTLEAKGRIENLEEFLSAASELDGLGLDGFLDRITLMADADEVEQDSRITMMTIHCAKGLEFPTVFLVGMEEDVFPNRMAKEDDGLEEERRLFYVAITRAQRKLYMSGARRRAAFGGPPTLGMPSRFLKEVPTEALDQPIRWGTEMFQAGQGAWTPTPARGGGGVSVAGELSRIRSMFSQVKAQATSESGEESVEAPPPPECAPGDAWPVGTRVRSPRFGRGVITGASGRGDMITYTVRFADSGEKRIVAKYGMLEKE